MIFLIAIIWIIVVVLCWLPTISLTIIKPIPFSFLNEFTARTIFYFIAVTSSFVLGILLGILSKL